MERRMRALNLIAIAGTALAGILLVANRSRMMGGQTAQEETPQLEGQGLPGFAAVTDQPAEAVLMDAEMPMPAGEDYFEEDEVEADDVEAVIEEVVSQPHPDTVMAHAFAAAVEDRATG